MNLVLIRSTGQVGVKTNSGTNTEHKGQNNPLKWFSRIKNTHRQTHCVLIVQDQLWLLK